MHDSASATPPAVPVPRAVVFDMDGLIFNTEDIYTLVGTELMRRRGREFSDALKDAVMGLSPRATFETMIRWHALSDTWEAMREESNEVFIGLFPGHLRIMPGLVELLDALETAGIPKSIATGSGRKLAEVCLASFALAERFRFVLTADEITHGKPHPEIYLTAAKRLALRPQEILVLEDSRNGCLAAAEAGAFAVAVPGQHSRDQDFSAAALVIDHLADRRLYEVLGIGPTPSE